MDKEQYTKKEYKASLTIEMSFIIPVVLFIFMGIVLSVFYQHDKNILHGAAYETAVVGSLKMREKEEVTEEVLEELCKERLRGKCIFLTSAKVDVSIQEEEVAVQIVSGRRGYKASVIKRAAVTEPEKKIRNIRR